MKFDKPDQVREVVRQMQDADIALHSFNRAKIDELAEGFPPFNEEEQDINHFDTNVNFLEAPGLLHKARSTWNNAFLKPGRFFAVTLDSGPVHKRGEWGATITKEINRALKGSLPYIETIRATGAQVVLHGVGPKLWERSKGWRPVEVAIEDLLVPARTRVNLGNLDYFAVYREYTPAELYGMTHGGHTDPGWNMEVVGKVLQRLSAEPMRQQDAYQDVMNPEKLVKFYKANTGFLDSDAVPTANVWDFYFSEDDAQQSWQRLMILDDQEYEGSAFLYNPRRPFAASRDQILHVQFGDGANVVPFLWHTVRSLGYLLFGVCHLQNRLRCNFMDAIMRATHEYFRVANADDRARIQSAQLTNLGLVPNGLEFVPVEQRWQPNENLIVAGLSQNRQLMSENASAFVQDVNDGTQKELTATEVMARLNNANALSSALLSMAYTYAKFEYREIARRFTNERGEDPDIRRFRERCLLAGVPAQYLNAERWEVEPERVMGGGNKTLELSQAKALMEVKAQFDGEAQRDILRNYTLAITDDPDKAERWVPAGREQPVTSSEHDAQLAFGAMMGLGQVGVREGIDHIGYVSAMLLSVKSAMDDIGMIGQPSPQQLAGFVGVFKHLQEHMKIVGQDPQNRQLVRQWGDFLKPYVNQVKQWMAAFKAQAQAQAQQSGDGKAQAAMLTAATKAKISEAQAAQKMKHKDVAFVSEQRRKDAATGANLRKQAVETAANVQALDAKTAASVRAQRVKAEASAAAAAEDAGETSETSE